MNSIVNIGILWRSYGPYHFARLRILQTQNEKIRVHAVEVSDLSKNYSWKVDRREIQNFTTLFKGKKDAEVNNLAFICRFIKWLHSSRIEILFIPSFWPAYTLLAGITARCLGIKVIMMTDSHLATGRNTAIRLLLKRFIVRRFQAAFVSGTLSAQYMEALGMPKDKIFYGLDVVDNCFFKEQNSKIWQNENLFRKKYNLKNKYILSLGRFVPKKNLGVLIEAYAKIAKEGRLNDNRLLFVGDGPLKRDLIKQCGSLGLKVADAGLEMDDDAGSADTVVEFRDFAQKDAVPVYYALATALVLPSSYEEWGLIINEAMASRCPIIASTSLGCAPDLLKHEYTALTFLPEDSEALAVNIRRMCNEDELRKHLILKAIERISNWDLQQFTDNFYKAVRAAQT